MGRISIRELKGVCAALANSRRQRGGEQPSARSSSGAHTEMTVFTLRNTRPHALTLRDTHTQWTKDSRTTYNHCVRTFSSSCRSLFTSFEAAYGGKNNFTVVHKSVVFVCFFLHTLFSNLISMNPSSVKYDETCCFLLCTVRKLSG